MIIFRIAVTAFAVLLILFGAIWTLSPIPFGFIFLILGFLLLVAAAPGEVRWLRKRWRSFDRAMHGLEKRLPEWIARRLRATDDDHDGAEEAKPEKKVRKARRA